MKISIINLYFPNLKVKKFPPLCACVRVYVCVCVHIYVYTVYQCPRFNANHVSSAAT